MAGYTKKIGGKGNEAGRGAPYHGSVPILLKKIKQFLVGLRPSTEDRAPNCKKLKAPVR